MSDKRKLQEKQLTENEYFRKNILNDLLASIDQKGEMLRSELYIPEMERDFQYLNEVLSELGYSAEYYDEEYNPYYECFCKKIKIA